MSHQSCLLMFLQSLLSLFYSLVYLQIFLLSLFLLQLLKIQLQSFSLHILLLFDQQLLFSLEVYNFFRGLQIIFIIVPNPLLLKLHLTKMFGLQFLYRAQGSILVFFHVIIPCMVELKQLVLLQGVNREHFGFLLHHQFLFMSSHLFIPYLQCFLMSFLRFNVHTCLFALFTILVKQFQKLHHSIVHKIIMSTRVKLGLIKQSQKLVKSNHFFCIENDSLQQIVIKYLNRGLLSQKTNCILLFYIALFSLIDFVKLLQQLLQLVAGLILHPNWYGQSLDNNIIIAISVIILNDFINMYFSLAQYNNIFVRPQKSNLILAVPLCARTVIFFCDDNMFYHYSLIDSKILYQSKLPGRIVHAISLSGHEILCTIRESRILLLLNIDEKSFEQICQLPQTKMYNENRQKDIFTQIRLNIFQKSNKFYIEQPRIQENKTKIYFYNRSTAQNHKVKMDNFVIKQLNTRKIVLKKLDSDCRLVLFKQDIDQNGIFKFNTIDCQQDFNNIQYACENKAFTRFSIVRQIRSISHSSDERNRMLIFVNSSTPEILIFAHNEVHDFPYKSKKIFLSTILINVQFGYGMFMFMPSQDDPNPSHENVIQLINFQTGVVLQRKKITVNEVIKSWEDDYILFYRKETIPSTSSPFQTENIISKNAFYMKMLWEKGLSQFSEKFLGQVISCLQQ